MAVKDQEKTTFITCNTPDVIYLICTPTLAVSGIKLFFFSGSGFCLRVLLSLSCISYHVIMCIAFAYVFNSCIRAFSPLSVLHSGAPISSGGPFYLFSCVGVKRFQIGPRLVVRPWFTTGRPPVKFRAIWSSFDTPMVNQGTVKASCVAAQHPSNLAQNPPKPSPSSRAFDHDRVAENRTSFGMS